MLTRIIHKSILGRASFGLMSEYGDRVNKKLYKGVLVNEKPQFFTTSARPGNFGDHLDFKINIDNWFDENRYISFSKIRLHNEHETDIKRT